MTARAMDHDDDVEHLFSWLQTPELRYREFAGAREITDTVVVVHQQRANDAPVPGDVPAEPLDHGTQLVEEYPQEQFPETRIEVVPAARMERVVVREEIVVDPPVEIRSASRGPIMIAPELATPEPPVADPNRPDNAGLFALGAAGRGPTGPAVAPRPPPIQTPAAPSTAPVPPPPMSPPPPQAAAPQEPPARPAVPAAGGRLFGGTYRETDPGENGASPAAAEPPAAPADQPRDDRSLDAVFGRLAGGRSRLPDPRERLRHIPGLGPPSGRQR